MVALAGNALLLLAEGALWWPDERMLIVADLHLEKGSSLARRGVFLPPYDTAATLATLGALCARHDPRTVMALGDSFHDRDAAARIGREARTAIAAMQRGRDWLWITGNHDPQAPHGLGGMSAHELSLSGLNFRHEPGMGHDEPHPGTAAQVAGHLHPCGRVRVRGGVLRRRCFIASPTRMILPALGAYAGGLNVLDDAFAPLFPDNFYAYMLGNRAVYRIARRRLVAEHRCSRPPAS